jgi:Helix-turn-helix domain
LSCGYEIEEVAEILLFSPRWVQALRKHYNEGGAEALGDQRAPKERIKSGPKIARWLAKFRVRICPGPARVGPP